VGIERMTGHLNNQPIQRLKEARPVRMDRKVVLWVAFTATMVALVCFSILFIHAAYRNHWL